MYRLQFLEKKDTINSGDGITIDNNIYILNEIDMKKSLLKLEILIQQKDPIKQSDSSIATKKKKNQEQSDYDSVGLLSDNPIRRSKSKIEFDGYLISTIKSKNIDDNLKKKMKIETDDNKCIFCFDYLLK
jgi:hypothetical protein